MHHPWHWKPFTCWLNPLVILPASTHCGRPEPGGRPAHEILERELRALSTLSGRDFLRELRAPPAP